MTYIDTKYLGKCETCRNFRNGKCNTYCDHGEEYSPNLSKIPTADVAPVRHGKWIITDHTEYGVEAKCSECGYEMIFGRCHIGKYCPDCGAKMDGGNK